MRRILGLSASFIILLSVLMPAAAAKQAYTVNDLESVIGGIVAWKSGSIGAETAQELIDNGLSETPGSGNAEWYIIALSRYYKGLSYKSYVSKLNEYIASRESIPAVDRIRIALAFSACKEGREYIESTLDSSVASLGIMSRTYGLILTDSGSYTSLNTSRDNIIEEIISLELPGGGFALNGNTADIDVTAMTLTALAPYRGRETVKAVIDRGLKVLSDRQNTDGDYSSWGKQNAESTAQVVCALCSLGINPLTDSRFIKNGNTAVDGLMLYLTGSGGFSHTRGAAAGDTASSQALYSLIALWRLQSKKAPLFSFGQNESASETAALKNDADNNGGTAQGKKADTDTPSTPNSGLSVSESSSEVKSSEGNDGSTAAQSDSGFYTSGQTDYTDNSTYKQIDSDSSKAVGISGYMMFRLIALAVITVCAASVIIALRLRHRLNKKNLIITIACALILMAAAAFLKVQSPEQYYSSLTSEITGTITVEIRCDNAVTTVTGEGGVQNSVILEKTAVPFKDGDTAFDVLVRAAAQNKIQLLYEGTEAAGYYIKGIGGLSEFDEGPLSGWLYYVNGASPDTGCSSYKLSDGDAVVWAYSLDMGKDVSLAESENSQPQ